MFIREKHRQQKSAGLPYLVLVESHPTPKGSRQSIVLSLGRMDLPKEQRQTLADMVSRRLAGQQTVLDEPPDLKDLADRILAKTLSRRARMSIADDPAALLPAAFGQIKAAGVRELGPILLIEHFWKRLAFDDILRETGASDSEVMRVKLAVFCRLLDFGTTAEGIDRFEAGCFGEWIPEACRRFRREKVIVPDRILNNRDLFDRLLRERQREFLGAAGDACFADFRHPCVCLLLDSRGLIVAHHVLKRDAFRGGNLPDAVKRMTVNGAEQPVAVLDSRDVTERDLQRLGSSQMQYYVIRDFRMSSADGRDLSGAMEYQETWRGYADRDSSGTGDLYLSADPGRGRCSPAFSPGRTTGSEPQGSGPKEWVLRSNKSPHETDSLLRDIAMLMHARERFSRYRETAPTSRSRRSLGRDVFTCLAAYHIVSAVDETMKSLGGEGGWERICRILRACSVVSVVVPGGKGEGYACQISLSTGPDRETAEVWRRLGIPVPSVRNVSRIIDDRIGVHQTAP